MAGNFAVSQDSNGLSVTFYPDGDAPRPDGFEKAPATMAEVKSLLRFWVRNAFGRGANRRASARDQIAILTRGECVSEGGGWIEF